MKRHLIAAMTAAAVAFTSLSTPAFAESKTDRQVLTLLLGAAALGLIINESKKNDRRDSVGSRYDPNYRPYFLPPNDYGRDRGRDRSRHDRRPRLLPAKCAYEMRGYNGRAEVLSYQCLADFGLHRNLPRECVLDVRGKHQSDRVYGARCLRRNGYEIANILF